jgi:hypothetical protein
LPRIIIPAILASILLLALAACGVSAPPTAAPQPTPTATPVPPAPAGFDQAGLEALLSLEEVAAAFPDLDWAGPTFIDFGVGATAVDPAQMVGVDSFTGLAYSSATAGITFR